MLLNELIIKKLLRFFIGWFVTLISIYLGFWYGKKLAAQGITGENYFQKNRVDRYVVIRIIAIITVLIGSYLYLDRYTMFLHYISPYARQGSMVLIRSLLAFLFVFQWQIWLDKAKLRRSIIPTGIGIIALSIVEILILLPSFFFIGHEISKDGVLLQTSRTTCSPTALANIMRLYGQNFRERDAAIVFETGMTGTTDTEAAEGAKKLGFKDAAPWRPTFEQIASENLPLIVTIDSSGVPHAVAVFGVSSNTVCIADPYVGLVYYTRDDFLKVYKGNAVRLGLPSLTYSKIPWLSDFNASEFTAMSLAMEK